MKTQLRNVIEFYNAYPEYIGQLLVDTRYGYQTIEYADITAIDSTVHEIVLENNAFIQCSPDHMLWCNDGWVACKNICIGDIIHCNNGKYHVTDNIILPKTETLYDLQVANINEFFADSFVSHNSTILDALTFALYGKPYRKINKAQVVNSINGTGCVVEVVLKVSGSTYVVSRGIKPNTFTITRDGVALPETANRDQQCWLETVVLRCSYKSFCRVAVLGTATFMPFMQLPAWQRRELIEDLLDLKIFATMNAALKARTQTREVRVSELNSDLAVLNSTLQLIEKRRLEVAARKDIDVEEKKRRVKDAEDQIAALQVTERDFLARSVHLKGTIDTVLALRSELRDLEKLKSRIQVNRRSLVKDMGIFQQDSCPTCLQAIAGEYREATLRTKRTKLSELDTGLALIDQKVAAHGEELELAGDPEAEMAENSTLLAVTVSKVQALSSYVKELENDVSAMIDVDIDTTEEEELKDRRRVVVDELSSLRTHGALLATAQQLLRDEGVKSLLVQRYVPKINSHIAEFIRAMNFMCRFELDAEFNERVLSRGMDEFSYESFSEGQKQRIDLALLFTWREIARKRNSVSVNLLVLDEVFDRSLDGTGIEDVAAIIKKLSEKSKVVVISHRDQMTDKFDEVLLFSQKRNFSQVERV